MNDLGCHDYLKSIQGGRTNCTVLISRSVGLSHTGLLWLVTSCPPCSCHYIEFHLYCVIFVCVVVSRAHLGVLMVCCHNRL